MGIVNPCFSCLNQYNSSVLFQLLWFVSLSNEVSVYHLRSYVSRRNLSLRFLAKIDWISIKMQHNFVNNYQLYSSDRWIWHKRHLVGCLSFLFVRMVLIDIRVFLEMLLSTLWLASTASSYNLCLQ